MALFLSLYLGHVLGDFVFQPGRLVLAKRHSERAVITHALIVTACTAFVLLRSLPATWPALLLAGGAHLAVEHLTIRARRAPGTSNVTVFLLDQALHVVSMVIIAAAAMSLQAEPSIALWPVSLQVMATVCGAATVAFGGSILVFEVQVALDPGTDGPDPILTLDAERLYGFAERGGALVAAVLLPWPLVGLLAFVPRLICAQVCAADARARHLAAAAVGAGLCVIAWALVSAMGA